MVGTVSPVTEVNSTAHYSRMEVWAYGLSIPIFRIDRFAIPSLGLVHKDLTDCILYMSFLPVSLSIC